MQLLSLAETARLLLVRGGTLGSLLDGLETVFGDRTMVVQASGIGLAGGKNTLTYREASALVARASTLLRQQCEGGRKIVIRGPNGYDFFLTCLAVSRAGGVVAPVNPHMREEEVAWVVDDAKGEILEIGDLIDRMSSNKEISSRTPLPSVSSDAVAAILYTSGTTGKPKGAVLTHRGLLDQPSRALLFPQRLTDFELVIGLPVAHIMGLEALLLAAMAGVSVVFLPRFHPLEALDAIEKRRPRAFLGVPAMYRMMLDAGAEKRDLRSVRLWMSSADVMPEELARRFKQMGSTIDIPGLARPIGEAFFAEGYGMVELAGLVTLKFSPPLVPVGLGDFLGIPLPPYRYRVVDEQGGEAPAGVVGELAVAGSGVQRGYHRNVEATRASTIGGGWVRTGDLARRGRLGIVHFAGRKKDVIKHGGYSVFPAEVEETLRKHPGVADVAVVGRPDRTKGEIPTAFVEAAPGAKIDTDDLERWALEHLADYKVPREIIVMEQLPRTGTRKVAKQALRERLEAQRP